MSSKNKRLSAGSTPINNNSSTTGSNRSIEGTSPILPSNLKRKISFSSDSDSDSEIIFTKQANKRKKMSDKEELKLWFTKQFGDKIEKINQLATGAQVDSLKEEIQRNSARTEENTKEVAID